MIYIPERDHTFPATSPERPFYGFSVAGMNIAAYCASRLREVGFEAVFDPGTPVSEEKGEIIERGSHDELIEQKGRYYKLYTGQFELD